MFLNYYALFKTPILVALTPADTAHALEAATDEQVVASALEVGQPQHAGWRGRCPGARPTAVGDGERAWGRTAGSCCSRWLAADALDVGGWYGQQRGRIAGTWRLLEGAGLFCQLVWLRGGSSCRRPSAAPASSALTHPTSHPPATPQPRAIDHPAPQALQDMVSAGREAPAPVQTIVTRWGSDPWSRGSYSYYAVGNRLDIVGGCVAGGKGKAWVWLYVEGGPRAESHVKLSAHMLRVERFACAASELARRHKKQPLSSTPALAHPPASHPCPRRPRAAYRPGAVRRRAHQPPPGHRARRVRVWAQGGGAPAGHSRPCRRRWRRRRWQRGAHHQQRMARGCRPHQCCAAGCWGARGHRAFAGRGAGRRRGGAASGIWLMGLVFSERCCVQNIHEGAAPRVPGRTRTGCPHEF